MQSRPNPQRRQLLRTATVAAALGVTGPVRAQARPPLVAWFTVEGAKAFRQIGERFTAETGVELIVETPDPLERPTKFQQDAAAGKGPDIYVYAHDKAREWTASGLLRSVTPGRRLREDIEPLAWKGFPLRGRIWGYPYAIEAITLIYNKALVSTPPKSFEEVFVLDAQLARQGKKAILWDNTNNHFSWPLFASGGGYAFRERADGSYNPRDTGVNNAGALAGGTLDFLKLDTEAVVAYTRRLADRQLTVIVNLSAQAQTFGLIERQPQTLAPWAWTLETR